MDIVRLKMFNFSKREVQQFGQSSKKNPNNVCECIITLYSFSISKEKIDQAISVVLRKLAKKDIEIFQSDVAESR